MNKLLLPILLLVVSVAGGGYLFLNSDKNIAQYLPQPIADILGLNTPSGTERVNVAQQNNQVEEAVAADDTETTPEKMVTQDESAEVTSIEPVQKQAVIQKAQENLEPVTDAAPIVENQLEEQKIANNDETNLTSVSETEQSPKQAMNKPIEVIKLEKELNEKSTSVSQLDRENEKLQHKFKQMLEQNKNLAMKLSQMEKKLKESN